MRKPTASLSDQIRSVIAARGLTAAAVAAEAKLNPSVVARFLSHARGASSDSLDAMAEVLDLRVVEGRCGLRANPRRRRRAG